MSIINTRLKHELGSMAPLEARSLLSANPVALLNNNAPATELVIVDCGITDSSTIVADLRREQQEGRAIEILQIQTDQDGIDIISQALANRHDLRAIHIVSHGSDGLVRLGDTNLDLGTLSGNRGREIESWSSALAPNGDLLLYGCSVAASNVGKQFVNALHRTSGADVAASTNLTGNVRFGGDWALEYHTGMIETELAVSDAEQKDYAGTFLALTVSNTNNSGAGSFRQAILDANAAVAASTISFNLSTADANYNSGTGKWTITLTSAFAQITKQVTIDATTQSGWTAGNPVIVLAGGSAGAGTHGIDLQTGSAGSTVKGLLINGFGSNGINITSANNIIQGNWIGLSAGGTTKVANLYGVYVTGAAGNTIGGTTAATRNVISGNTLDGIDLDGAATTSTFVQGNYFGTDTNGSAASGFGNSRFGVYVRNGATGNTIGGSVSGAGNVISGNTTFGVRIDGSSNTVQGNTIGLNAAGTAKLANSVGVFISNGANNTVGGTTTLARNVISGNTNDGVNITGASATGNTIQGNYIGLGSDGTTILGNSAVGVNILSSAMGNTVGGSVSGAGNVISGNTSYGVYLQAGSNAISGNIIGLNAAGTAKRANSHGIYILSAGNNTIGGTTSLERNIISGNANEGIYARNAPSTGNVISGNYIGTDITGTTSLGNTTGVNLDQGASGNTIGGTATGAGNVISGNSSRGINIRINSNNITIAGNIVGLNAAGTAKIANNQGIVFASADNSTVGGTIAAARNIISGNTTDGIVADGFANNITIRGNYIGLGSDGSTGLGNGRYGVWLETFSGGNQLGGSVSGARNVISGNTSYGVYVNGPSNTISGNIIGLNATGTAAVANSYGVYINNKANNTIGGTTALARNIISGNTNDGVYITGASATGNLIRGNYIGLGSDGTTTLGNSGTGVNILSGATGNTIGGAVSGAGNVISGNLSYGVYLQAGSNTVSGNTIGLDATGTVPKANTGGVNVSNAASNTIGGTTTLARNIISGNTGDGVSINGGSSTGNVISGNYIGTDVNGTIGLGNGSRGVSINNGSENTVGGTASGAGNVISGNSAQGIYGFASNNHVIQGNIIGLNAAGTAKLANSRGIEFASSSNNTVGGTTTAARNVISGNTNEGIFADGFANATIQGNYIGLGSNGLTALGNGGHGINLQSFGGGNLVGGSVSGAGNVISGNTGSGVYLDTSSNTVAGNIIGLNALGSAKLANSYGVYIPNKANNTVGGTTSLARNVISGNTNDGVYITGATATGNSIQGNYIGLGSDGTTALGNSGTGVNILSGVTGNTIGGSVSGTGNVISGNANYGVYLQADSNTIQGNTIGLNAAGTAKVANSYGVYISSAASNTIGGTTTLTRNIISGNSNEGIFLTGASTTGTSIKGNFIGTDSTGVLNFGNLGAGITVAGGATNNSIGGTNTGEGNIIAFNGAQGIAITGGSQNAIQRNSIFSNSSLGIDLNGDGITANDAITTIGQPNLLTDFPVFTSGTVAGTTLALSGYIGNSSGQATFANNSIEVFISDGSSTNGSGKTYLGTLTSDANGNFCGSLIVSGISFGDKITATATDASGNTSEFGLNFTLFASTSTTLTTSNSTVTYGQSITFTSTVTVISGSGPATGTVSFFNGGTTLGTVSLSSGTAAFTISSLSSGTYTTIYAIYSGDTNFTTSTSNNVSLTVNQAALTITANDASKTYGDTLTFTGTEFTTSGLVNSDTVTSATLTSTGSPATASFGTYTITGSSALGTGLSNYTISYVDGTLTVNQAALTITANDASKTYGDTLTFTGTEFTTSGLVNSDTVTSATLTSTGSPATASFGTYTITGSSALGTGLSNYTISYVDGTLTVNQAALTITANDASKTYGDTLTFTGTEFTTSGLVNSDTVTSATLTSTGSPGTASFGTYTITGSSALGTGLSNYTISYVDGTLTVNQAALTITANDASKTYGDTLTFTGTEFTTSGLVNSDTVTSATLTSTGSPATASFGTYTITGSSALGTGLSNYTISYVDGTLTVNQAALTITANDASKTYGDTLTFTGTEFTTSGLVNSDTVTSATLTSTGSPGTASFGTYTITGSSALGTGLSNYTISYVDGTLTVNQAALTITANDASKTYGDTLTFTGTEFTTSGLVNSDTVTSATLTSTGTPGTASFGSYSIVGSGATGTGLSNYTISYVDGTLTVNQAALTITANDASKTYGDTLTFTGTEFSTSGLVNSDTVTSATLTSTGSPATASFGTYTITGSSALGTGLSNYTISYVDGTLTVNQAALTITANDASKTYGDTLTFTGTEFTTSGLVNSDTVTSATLNSTGTPGTASFGIYSIVGNGATGTGLSNYTISYVDGTLTVNQAALTITANDASKTYGDTLTFTGTEFTTSGLVNSDTVTSATLTSTGSPATASFGTYTITGSSALGTGLSNYTISYVDGTLTVNQAARTVNVNDQPHSKAAEENYRISKTLLPGVAKPNDVSEMLSLNLSQSRVSSLRELTVFIGRIESDQAQRIVLPVFPEFSARIEVPSNPTPGSLDSRIDQFRRSQLVNDLQRFRPLVLDSQWMHRVFKQISAIKSASLRLLLTLPTIKSGKQLWPLDQSHTKQTNALFSRLSNGTPQVLSKPSEVESSVTLNEDSIKFMKDQLQNSLPSSPGLSATKSRWYFSNNAEQLVCDTQVISQELPIILLGVFGYTFLMAIRNRDCRKSPLLHASFLTRCSKSPLHWSCRGISFSRTTMIVCRSDW